MKQSKKVIGITGGIASGKSTAVKELRNKGYIVIDSDAIWHDLIKKGNSCYERIISNFGKEILSEDGEIDRKTLGKLIFSDIEAKEKLNTIAHEEIIKEIKSRIDLIESGLIFVDIPLLFEKKQLIFNNNIRFHAIILIYTNKETQINRLMLRDSISKYEALNRINSQMSLDEKRELSDIVIDNSGDIKTLYEQIDQLLLKI